MEVLYWDAMGSPIGELLLAASDGGLQLIEWGSHEFPPHKLAADWRHSPERLRPYADELRQYFAGTRREFTFPLDLRGTPFQQRCWHELLRIPFGKTCSYAELARAVDRPAAFRAVGQANHHNPIPIVVPCHRVLTSGGKLGGYGGGLAMKRRLLALEGVSVQG